MSLGEKKSSQDLEQVTQSSISYKRRILITTIFTIRKISLRSYEEESWIVISKIYANCKDCQDGCLRRSRKLLEKGV